jgi:hypothetical protein
VITATLADYFALLFPSLDRRQLCMSLETGAALNRSPLIIHQKSSIASVYPRYSNAVVSVPVRFESMAYEYP